MFFWLLCTQFYTPIFGLFYTQYSLLITIIHCCWYITIMLYIYIFIPTLYPSALIHTYIYIHHHYTNCIPGPMFDIILCLCIHIHIYIYISPLLLVYHNILYIYGGFLCHGGSHGICLGGRFHQHRRAGVVPRHGDLGALAMGKP